MNRSSIEALLVKLKLFDPDHSLSLTNATLIVLIVKLALTPSLDTPTLTAFFLSLLAYNGKKFSAHKKKVHEDKVQGLGDVERQRLDKIEAELKMVTQAISLKKLQG